MINNMLKCNLQPLLTVVTTLIMLFTTVEIKSQVTPKFRGMTFDEIG